MKPTKKGQVFQNLGNLGIGIGGLAIILVVTFLIMATAGEQAATINGDANLSDCGSSACNGTKVLTNAVGDIPGWIPIVVITAIGGILIGLVSIFRR